MNYQEYIKAELLILVPVMYFIGIGLKKSKLPDKWIPLTLGGISVVLALIWVFATGDVLNVKEAAYALFTAVTQGVLVAGAGVYANQIYIQSTKEK